MSVEIPDLPATCWPVDWSCEPQADEIDPVVKDRAEALAIQTLRALTAYRVGGCPVSVRPCARQCLPPAYQVFPVSGSGGWMTPFINESGSWVNACGCRTDCSCGSLSEVVLPSGIGAVLEVQVDGVILASTDWRVDNGNRLVRTDGDLWPTCQDMAAAPGEEGTFVVTYSPGAVPDGLAAYVAGVLAAEYAKACGNTKCALPKTVTSVVRAGVSMTFGQEAFPRGLTGITVVDSWLRTWNPYGVTLGPGVYSLDRPPVRQTTSA